MSCKKYQDVVPDVVISQAAYLMRISDHIVNGLVVEFRRWLSFRLKKGEQS